MRLYTGTSETLIRDTQLNSVADKLSRAFFKEYRYKPSPQEVISWQNSLRAMAQVLQVAELKNLGVALEYQLPKAMQRLDCLFTGLNESERDQAVVVELKQWQECHPSEGGREVRTWLGGTKRDVQHPSAQVAGYRRYLSESNTAFYDGDAPVLLDSCCYLHNYPFVAEDHIFDPKFKGLLDLNPLFTKDDVLRFSEYLRLRLKSGDGQRVLERIEQGQERPARKLLDHVARMISGEPAFTLLDEQSTVYDLILAKASAKYDPSRKTAFIIKGGPGTGKSLIAVNLLADLMLQGKDAYYATGSKAFTTTLQEIVGERAKRKFVYFMTIGVRPKDDIDVLIADEAHRIRKDNNTRFTKKDKRDPRPQIETLLTAAKVPVFFIDDRQLVRPDEKGSTEIIRDAAARLNVSVVEFQLEGQFRCGGCEGFVQWVDNTLEIARTPSVIWDNSKEEFEFKIFDSPEELDRAIREKSDSGAVARITAGYCWPWTQTARPDGSLEKDVVIGDFKRPWNAPNEITGLAKGIPKANLWAHSPAGVDQIGCVYTAQGFEFDYVGVIVGRDLRFDFDAQRWVADKSACFDPSVKRGGDKFIDLIKNTYRVLLTRGIRGCYVYFQDKDTERFFRSRTESSLENSPERPILVADPGAKAFVEYLPVYSLKVAAGYFGAGTAVDPEGWIKAVGASKFSVDHFVAKVVGKSMEPLISDGSYCIFRRHKAGSRQGKIVLVQSHKIEDPDSGGSFTVKRYRSEKVFDDDGGWKHSRIVLEPRNTDYQEIVLTAEDENEVSVIAEFVKTLV